MKYTALIIAVAAALPLSANAQEPAKKKVKPVAGPVIAEAQVASGVRRVRGANPVVIQTTGKPVVSNP